MSLAESLELYHQLGGLADPKHKTIKVLSGRKIKGECGVEVPADAGGGESGSFSPEQS